MNVIAFILAVAAIILFFVKPLQYGLAALTTAWIVQLVWATDLIRVKG